MHGALQNSKRSTQGTLKAAGAASTCVATAGLQGSWERPDLLWVVTLPAAGGQRPSPEQARDAALPEQLGEGRTERGSPLCQKTERVGWKGNPTPHPNPCRQLGETEGRQRGQQAAKAELGAKEGEPAMAERGANTRGWGAPALTPLSTRVVQVDTGAGCPALPVCRRQDKASQEPMF